MTAPIRVLLVEDSPSDVLLLREALVRGSEVRFEITHAEFLRDALDHLTRTEAAGSPGNTDVVLLDLGLPDSDGLETFLTLQRHAPALPVVVLTGRADETLGVRAVQEGAQDYLVKGQVEGRTLVRAVRYAIERRHAEATVRQYAERREHLSRNLLEAQEAERRRLARELHDEIGQVLTAVKINLQAVRNHVSPSGLPRVEESIEVVNRAIQQVRDLSLDLRPSLLDDLGLAAAVRWYVDRQAQRADLAIHAAIDVAPGLLQPETETVCFRIIQEALTNVVRHSQARHVQIMLTCQGGELVLLISDDGVGFDPATVDPAAGRRRGLGLLGMQERVHLAGGHLEIATRPQQGTEIRVRLPLGPSSPGRSPGE